MSCPRAERVQNLGDPPKPLPPPKTLRAVPDIQAIRVRNGIWNPRIPTGPEVCARHGQPGEISALARLNAFLEGGVRATSAGPTAGEHQGCRRTCASAWNSARPIRGGSSITGRAANAR